MTQHRPPFQRQNQTIRPLFKPIPRVRIVYEMQGLEMGKAMGGRGPREEDERKQTGRREGKS